MNDHEMHLIICLPYSNKISLLTIILLFFLLFYTGFLINSGQSLKTCQSD